ncbi:hypothetical protein Taro_041996 [Colocasia esculenta]|uniref:Uncharacterized protein n=1 Tax=Colocasia esculenta TaxID=4460 RepID=A0A843WFR7_COLES|nr:hypothetical protein [Colocasia esculenta]
MNHCAVQQNAMAACDEMRSPFAAVMSDCRDPVFCPKPLRVSRFCGGDPVRPLRWQLGHQADPCDSKSGADVLDLILTKGAYGDVEHQSGESQVASSPPYFCSSPPSRSTNPLVFDARFGDEKSAPLTPLPMLATPPSAAAPRMGGCVRTKFGPKPAAVRIEGFDCLDRDGRRSSCGITAVA